MRTQSDERLVDLVRAGNPGAFEAIVARYRRPLLRYCQRILPEGRAEDAVQQTLLSAYDALRRSGDDMQLRAWLYRIAHNTSLNALRDRSLGHSELDETIDGVERPDQAFEKNQELREMVAAVKGLPERQRSAIVLRELEGRSYGEIASYLGVSDGSVRMLLNRARATMRAGMTAVTPYGLLLRLPSESGGAADAGAASRIGELTVGGAGGALALKAAATVLVAGAVVGGGVSVQGPGHEPSVPVAPAEANVAPTVGAGASTPRAGTSAGGPGGRDGLGHGRSSGARHGGGGDDHSGGKSNRSHRRDGSGSADDSGGSRRGSDDGSATDGGSSEADRSGPAQGSNDAIADTGRGSGSGDSGSATPDESAASGGGSAGGLAEADPAQSGSGSEGSQGGFSSGSGKTLSAVHDKPAIE